LTTSGNQGKGSGSISARSYCSHRKSDWRSFAQTWFLYFPDCWERESASWRLTLAGKRACEIIKEETW